MICRSEIPTIDEQCVIGVTETTCTTVQVPAPDSEQQATLIMHSGTSAVAQLIALQSFMHNMIRHVFICKTNCKPKILVIIKYNGEVE